MSEFFTIILATIAIYVSLIILTRSLGVRSFSKISSFDYAVTIAFGSILASVAMSPDKSMAKGFLALVLLFLIQWIISELRRHSNIIELIVDNKPVLLVAHGEIIQENLAKAKLTKNDVYSKLRVKGYCSLENIFAMIIETTGDTAVITADKPIDWDVLSEIKDLDYLKNNKINSN